MKAICSGFLLCLLLSTWCKGDSFILLNGKKVEGEIWRIPKTGGTPELFASNIGNYQDITFNKQGNKLFVSVRARNQVIQISAKKKAW